MALLSLNSLNPFRLFCLTLAGLMAMVALAACSSDPEPAPAPPDASASAGNTDLQPLADAAQVPEPTNMPVTGSPQRDPAPASIISPAPTPLVVRPTPTRRPVTSPVREIATPSAAGNVADAASTIPENESTLQISPGSTWGDVYGSLPEEEQSCIMDKIGAERLGRMQDRPFGLEGLEQDSVILLDCVSDDTARELFLADTAAQMGGLTREQEGCLRTLLGGFSPAELAAASTGEPTPEGALLMLSFGLGLVGCIPELAQGGGPPPSPDGAGPLDGGAPDSSLLWSFTTGGWVLAAPTVVDGVVYAGSDDHSLYALMADTGELLWSYATGDVIRSTPTVVDGKVFFGSNDNHLYALDAITGQELWKYDTGDWVQYSPAVSGGRVYFGAPSGGDRKVHALDAATGEAAWVAEHPFPIGAEHTPTPAGDKVYAQGAEYGQFFALDAVTGQAVWQAEVGGYVESSPTVLDGVVYLTVVNQAYALDESTGDVIWEVNTEEFPARDFPSLVVSGIYYLAPSDKVYALDIATGEELWSYEPGMLSTAPVVDDGVLYGASGSAEYIFALDAATGEELWTQTTEDFTTNALSVAEGVLYGELSNGQLVAANAGSGIPVWSFEKGGFSDVRGYTVKDGVVYSAGPNNSVYAHRAP